MTASAETLSRDLKRLSILVVDDDQDMLRLMRTMFQRLGLNRITLMHDPREALSLPECNAPDVVISDWELTAMKGQDFVARFRRTEAATPQTGYFLMTGRPVPERVTEAKRLGVQGLIAKPVSPKILRTNLERYLERRHRLAPETRPVPAPAPAPTTTPPCDDDGVIEI